MGAVFSLLIQIDHPVFGYDRRVGVESDGSGGQGRTALPVLIDACDINRVFRGIGQSGNGIAVCRDALYLLILSLAGLLVIQVVGAGIFHLFPGYFDALIVSRRGYIVRFVRFSAGLRRGGHTFTVSAAPGTVHGLHPHLILLVIHQLLAPKGDNVERILRNHHGLRRQPGLDLADLHLIACDIVFRIPGEGYSGASHRGA